MKPKTLFLLFLCLLLLTAAAGQKASKSKPSAPKPTGPKYDVASEITLKGVVDDVKQVPNSCLGETGLHLLLKTDSGVVEVQVAPVDFLKDMEVDFAKGDSLEIIGSQVTQDGSPLVLARSITRNKNELVVRDKQGNPEWTWMKKG
jgi:hypothetical protein